LKYPAAGAPDLAERVRTLLERAGFQSDVESKRGLDHGVFIPFCSSIQSDVPILQLSLQAVSIPTLHLAMVTPWRRCAIKAFSSWAAA